MKCPICCKILELKDHPMLPHFVCEEHGRFCINWVDENSLEETKKRNTT